MSTPLDALRSPLEICAFCPKLCRFACPVAEAESRETVTPWGLMTHADDLRRAGSAPGAESAELWSHCTGCDRCRAVCKHQNPVAETLHTLRAMTEAPHSVRLWAREAASDPPSWRSLPTAGPIRLMVGRANAARFSAALRVLSAAGHERLGRTTTPTAGGRLREVGLMEEYESHRASLLADLEGVSTVICLDAEDTVTLRREHPTGLEVCHVVEAVAGRVKTTNRVFTGDVLYLDACRCGRGLGLYDEPRAALESLLTGRIIEGLMERELGGCCGAGSGYAALEPERAAEMAREWASIAPDVPVIIVGACARHLAAALAPRTVWSWIEALAAGLEREENP